MALDGISGIIIYYLGKISTNPILPSDKHSRLHGPGFKGLMNAQRGRCDTVADAIDYLGAGQSVVSTIWWRPEYMCGVKTVKRKLPSATVELAAAFR